MSKMTRTKVIFIMWSLLILTHPTTTQSTTTSDPATTTTQSTTTSDPATTTTQSTITSDPATTTTQATPTSDPATTPTQSTTTSGTATTPAQSTTTRDPATTPTQSTTTSDTATTTTQSTTTSDPATTTTQSTTTSDPSTTPTQSTTTSDPATTPTQSTTTSDTATTTTQSTTTSDPATTTTQSTTTSDPSTKTSQSTTTSDPATTPTQSTTTSDTATTTTQSTTTSDPATTTTQSTTTGDQNTTTTQSTTGATPPPSQSTGAIPQSSSTSTPVVTTTLPESTVTSKPNLNGSTFILNFEIYVGLDFDAELNKSSHKYKEYEAEFKSKLSAVYLNLPEFLFVNILELDNVNGSVRCTHKVILRGTVEPDQLNKSLVETVLPEMENATFLNKPVTKSIDGQVNEAVKNVSNKCNAENICGTAFRCVGGDTESSNCLSTCSAAECEHGDCKVDSEQKFYCSCHHDDKFAYTGSRCDIVSEKLGLNEATIIGISVGLGGGVIVILVIVLGCMCYRRSREKKKDKLNSQFDDYLHPIHEVRDDKVRPSEMRRDEVRPYAVSSQVIGRPNYGFDPPDDGRYQRTFDNQPSAPRYTNEMDYEPHRSSGFDRKDDMRDQRRGNFRSGYHSDEDNGDWDDFKPAMNRDGGVDNRLTGQGRPFYDPADELEFDRTDGRRGSSGLSKGQPMLSQPPLLTGSVRDGESVWKHVDTEQTYAIKRPVFR